MLHLRKAAGTSLRDLITGVASRLGLALDIQEGGIVDPDVLRQPYTFTVTCIREPIDRVCSLYNYEALGEHEGWRRRPQVAEDFETWLQWSPPSRELRLWDEPADYYTKTLSGGPLDRRGHGCDAARFHRAKRVLEQFDLVLSIEAVGQPAYDGWWRSRLSLHEDTPMPMKRRTPTTGTDRDVRFHLSRAQRARLLESNRWDLELYRCARRWTNLRSGPDTRARS